MTYYITEAQLNRKQSKTVTLHAGGKCPLVNGKFDGTLVKIKLTDLKRRTAKLCRYCFG